jgi:TPR repeat protein
MTVAAVGLFALGFVLGANREHLAGLVGIGAQAVAMQSFDAANTAYQKGDYRTALRVSHALAREDDARAQSLLGLAYYEGRGVPRSDLEAMNWFRLAAAQGAASAQFHLGLMYSEGRGVPQNHVEAAKWYRLAADQGHAQSRYNLGVLYATGEGFEQDNVSAHMWFNLAAASFPPSDTRNRTAAVRSRDLVANKMTQDELAEAQRLAREWKPRSTNGS